MLACDSSEGTNTETVETDLNNIDYTEFEGKSLKEYEIPALIMLPDQTSNIGAAIEPEIIHEEGDFKWEITIGPNFTMKIEDYGNEKNMVEEEINRYVQLQ